VEGVEHVEDSHMYINFNSLNSLNN